MGAKAAIKGISKHEEQIVSFVKQEDGTFVRQVKKMTRDRSTNSIKHYKRKNPVVEDGPFKLVNATDDYDDKIEFESLDGSKDFLYFKKINEVISENM